MDSLAFNLSVRNMVEWIANNKVASDAVNRRLFGFIIIKTIAL